MNFPCLLLATIAAIVRPIKSCYTKIELVELVWQSGSSAWDSGSQGDLNYDKAARWTGRGVLRSHHRQVFQAILGWNLLWSLSWDHQSAIWVRDAMSGNWIKLLTSQWNCSRGWAISSKITNKQHTHRLLLSFFLSLSCTITCTVIHRLVFAPWRVFLSDASFLNGDQFLQKIGISCPESVPLKKFPIWSMCLSAGSYCMSICKHWRTHVFWEYPCWCNIEASTAVGKLRQIDTISLHTVVVLGFLEWVGIFYLLEGMVCQTELISTIVSSSHARCVVLLLEHVTFE